MVATLYKDFPYYIIFKLFNVIAPSVSCWHSDTAMDFQLDK